MQPTHPIIEWVNAISVVVLVLVTAYYAWTTRRILAESEKMRKASEKQAAAADQQALAAFATLAHLRQQVEELQGLGRSIVQTTTDSIIRSIEEWKKLDIKGKFAIAETFPAPRLLPENAQTVLDHARRISPDYAAQLRAAFDDLRSAEDQIEILRRGATAYRRGFFDPGAYDPNQYLTSAFSKLQDVRKLAS